MLFWLFLKYSVNSSQIKTIEYRLLPLRTSSNQSTISSEDIDQLKPSSAATSMIVSRRPSLSSRSSSSKSFIMLSTELYSVNLPRYLLNAPWKLKADVSGCFRIVSTLSERLSAPVYVSPASDTALRTDSTIALKSLSCVLIPADALRWTTRILPFALTPFTRASKVSIPFWVKYGVIESMLSSRICFMTNEA